MSMRVDDDARDEVLGERLRLALQDIAPRGEPDFAAVYTRVAEEDPPALALSARHPSRSRRWTHRLVLGLPVAAALALALNLGGDRPLPERETGGAFHHELSRLVGESVGPDWDFSPELAGAADPVMEELASFVADLWNRPAEGDD